MPPCTERPISQVRLVEYPAVQPATAGSSPSLDPAGKLIGRLYTGEQSSNVAWGDDGSTLYITSDYFMVRVKTKTKGAGW